MITFYLDSDKHLLRTSNTRIYQGESFMDKIQFIFPKEYEGQELKDFVFTLVWLDPSGVSHADILVLTDDDYKETYLQFAIPATSSITKTAGTIVVKVNIMKMRPDGVEEAILKTSSNTFNVTSTDDLDQDTSNVNVQLSIMNKKIAELGVSVETNTATKADSFYITADGKSIQLTSGGSPIGDPIPLTTLFKAQESAIDNETFKTTEF